MEIVRTRTLALFVVGALALVGMLAVALLDSRSQARSELEENFAARAKISAALIDSTLQAAVVTQVQQDQLTIAGPRVTPAQVARAAASLPGQTKIVTDSSGKVLAASPPSAAAVGADIRSRGPHVRSALAGSMAVVASVRGGQARIELAFPLETPHGRRVSVTVFPRSLVDGFLGSYLRRLLEADTDEAYILDPEGAVIAGARRGDAAPREPLDLDGARGQVTSRGGERIYSSAPVPSTDLRVVLLKSESELYAPIGGIGAWLIWVLFAGFTIMVGVALVLMQRLNRRARELSETNDTLALRNAEVERADRAKTDFLATMSHELRTPLNGIIGFAELMHDGRVGEVSDRHREYLGDILTSAHHLRRLIDDALDLSKVEAGMLDIRPEPVDVGQLVSEVSEALRSLAVSKELELAVDVDPSLDGVVTDPGHLKQVLYNYLSNALKFTERGGHIVVRACTEGASSFRLSVTDDGPGIAEDNIERLWSAFQQLDGRSRKYEGTGLGLALVKRIVEAQGGSVGVDTAPGRGSTFYAVLPRTARPASPPLPALTDA